MQSLIFNLDCDDTLFNNIVDNLSTTDIQVGLLKTEKFSDGEVSAFFKSSVRGKNIFILSSPNTSDKLMKLMLIMDAAKRAAAKEIIPIIPYMPYTRSDKKDQSRGPIGAKVIAEMIEHRGATSVITYDLHADQIQGFFNIPVIHIEGKNVFDKYINSIATADTILCGPDAGSGKRVKRVKEHLNEFYGLNLNYVMLDKTRKVANVVDEMVIIGDVTNKDVIILDDMVDTAGTLCKAAEVLMSAGAKSVRAVISHGVLSGKAHINVGGSMLKELIVSDSLPDKKEQIENSFKNYSETETELIKKAFDKIKRVTVADQIGLTMIALNKNLSYENLQKQIK